MQCATHAQGTKARPFKLAKVIAVRGWLSESERKRCEDAVKRARQGATPIVGTEYFNGQWMDVIVDVARAIPGMWVAGFEMEAA